MRDQIYPSSGSGIHVRVHLTGRAGSVDNDVPEARPPTFYFFSERFAAVKMSSGAGFAAWRRAGPEPDLGKAPEIQVRQAIANIFDRHSRGTLGHQFQIMPQLYVTQFNLVSNFAALECCE